MGYIHTPNTLAEAMVARAALSSRASALYRQDQSPETGERGRLCDGTQEAAIEVQIRDGRPLQQVG